MRMLWWNLRTYMLTEYRKGMFALCAFLIIGTCQIVPVYGIMEGELRLSRGQEIGVYLGGF